LPDHGLKARRIERPVDSFEIRIAEDQTHGFVIGLVKPKPASLFVERCFRDDLLQHLSVEAEGPRLIHGQRPAELAAHLLKPLGIDLAEQVGRYLGMADFGQRRLTETSENVGDAPDAKADDQDAHHRGHDRFAEPV